MDTQIVFWAFHHRGVPNNPTLLSERPPVMLLLEPPEAPLPARIPCGALA